MTTTVVIIRLVVEKNFFKAGVGMYLVLLCVFERVIENTRKKSAEE